MTRFFNQPVHLFLLLFSLLAITACGGGEPAAEPTPEAQAPEVQTVVVVATPTPAPAATVDETVPEEAAAADAPVLEAPAAAASDPTMTTLTDLNVRTGPGINYPIVGYLRSGSSARIIGKSPSGYWWKIECPPGAGSECWASAGTQYSAATNAEGIAIAAVPPAPTATPTATVQATATATATPTVAGNATATATTTGNATATATQAGTATATATQPSGNTPTATATTAGNATATATPTQASGATPTPTPTQATEDATPTATATEAAQIAPFDNDSLQNPARDVFLSITGDRNFTYSNDISYPEGDQEDWVQFEFPNNANPNQPMWVTLNCTLTSPDAQLRATLFEDGASTTKIAICNQGEVQLTVDNTKVQQLRIHFGITDEDGVYADYTLTVVGFK